MPYLASGTNQVFVYITKNWKQIRMLRVCVFSCVFLCVFSFILSLFVYACACACVELFRIKFVNFGFPFTKWTYFVQVFLFLAMKCTPKFSKRNCDGRNFDVNTMVWNYLFPMHVVSMRLYYVLAKHLHRCQHHRYHSYLHYCCRCHLLFDNS